MTKRPGLDLSPDVPPRDSVESPPEDALEENKALRRRLVQIIDRARQNEVALERFQALEIDLLGCERLVSMVTYLLHDARRRCGWDRVSLLLYDPDGEIRGLLDEVGREPAEFEGLLFAEEIGRLDALHGRLYEPKFGHFAFDRHGALFPDAEAPMGSVALLPLVRHGRIFGSYNLASVDSDRFCGRVGSEFLSHLGAVVSVALEIGVARDRLQHQGLADALTGVNNRRFFSQRLPEEITRAQREGTPLSCLFIDVDRFKQFNDRHGHLVGDRALRAVAESLRALLRSSDILARYGGEEFAAILPETDLDEATRIAERVRGGVESAQLAVDGLISSVTVSVGVATFAPTIPGALPSSIGASLVEAADRAMYRAKAAGRNRIMVEPLG